ncbi:hypothetical protein F0240_17550 [Vibrio kanaloae]|uniref:hypothetical protein n=1 Tax=Vibrio kanaloae TaxID=170673 RepID=UPI00148E6C67|nr:hypothetical protein [Vibrio kanaloae]NOJ01610.1 hypothetical protein [Vibrio kanaloae]
MSNKTMVEALIAKLYNGVIEIAEYTCTTLNKKDKIFDLAKNDPSFDEIQMLCKQLVEGLQEYRDVDSAFQQAEEVVNILSEIIEAITDHDNSVIVDCTFHLEQFLEINVRKDAA